MIWKNRKKLKYNQFLLFLFLMLFLFVILMVALMNGAVEIPLTTIKESFFTFDSKNQLHQIIRNTRLPRILGGVIVGSSLATSGALMQGITQNPLADSGLLGINAGAGLGLACGFAFFSQPEYWLILLLSFGGAAVSVTFIYLISRHSLIGITPIRLTLAGAGISALCISLSQGIALQFDLQQDLVFWSLGGVSAISWQQLKLITPFFIVMTGVALLKSPEVTVLRFGDDAAMNLGIRPQRLRILIGLVVLILSGLSVAVVGSISFVGLILPHFMRKFVGEDYKKLVPFSAVGGAILVVLADLIARVIHPPFEVPFGIILAIIGVPCFLYFFRKGEGTLQ